MGCPVVSLLVRLCSFVREHASITRLLLLFGRAMLRGGFCEVWAVEPARQEAVFFASLPGQAISYQIGKLQILRFLADARLKQGDRFSLRAFHDSLWKNGHGPIALQRWEALGLTDEIDAIDRER